MGTSLLLTHLLLNFGAFTDRSIPLGGGAEMHWKRGWMLWPGRVHLRGVVLTHATGALACRSDVEKVRVDVSLAALLDRRLETRGVLAQDVRVECGAPRVEARESERTGALPSVGGRPLLESFQLRGVQVLALREVTAAGLTWRGEGSAEGSIGLVPLKELHLTQARARLGPGPISADDASVGQLREAVVDGTVTARMESPGEALDILGGTDAQLRLSVELTSLQALAETERVPPTAASARGQGQLDVQLKLRKGTLAPGSRVSGAGRALALRLGPLTVAGAWEVRGEVEQGTNGASSHVSARLEPLRVTGGRGLLLLQAPRAVLELEAPTVRLGKATELSRVHLEVAPSSPVDLRLLQRWTGQSFEVLSGTATVRSTTVKPARAEDVFSRIDVATGPVSARWGPANLEGRAKAQLDVRRLALQRGALVLSGTEVTLGDVAVRTVNAAPPPWSASLRLSDATLRVEPPRLQARLEGRLTDAGPFVALVADERGVPRVLAPLLKPDDLTFKATLMLDEEGLRLTGLDAHGGTVRLRGEVAGRGELASAVLLVHLGPFTAGVEVERNHTRLHLWRPERWFEQRMGVMHE
ncbi:MAG: hypothetical protein L0Y66_05340 [Myxococcaceae bacterium]|nr:hypothetical protein [Myxococcaceae bacterium]